MDDLEFLNNKNGPDPDVLKQLSIACLNLEQSRQSIAFAEEKLKEMKQREEELSGTTIPDLLLAQGLTSITLDTGEKITISEVLYASVPKDPKNKGIVFQWLIKEGGQYLIKREVSIEEPEKWILELLKEKDVPHANKQAVNTNSFKAFLRAKLGLKKGSLQELEIGDVPKESNPYVRKETTIKR